MAIIPAILVGQNPLYPNIVVVSDVSTGSDGAITQRRVFVTDAQGNYLVPSGTTTNYTQWNISDSSISLNILTQDTAVNVLVQWLGASNNVLYTFTNQYPLSEYNKQFLYYLVEGQAFPSTPPITSDSNYDYNLAVLWTSVLGGINAISVNNDLAGSQNSMNRGTFLRLNQGLYF